MIPDLAQAQLTRKGVVTIQDVTNPRPAEGDIILPMPCDLTMTLRPVAIAVNGLLKDLETRMGSTNSDNFYDRQFVSFIASPLTLNDIPTNWQNIVKKQLGALSNQQLFFIGKYEITKAQWAAVMGGGCQALKSDSAQPQTDISWYESLSFTEKYTSWLLKNSPENLPSFANDSKNVGFLRLPTEAEWEYSARGGHSVSSNSLRSETLFPLEPNTTPKDYGVFRDGVSPPEQNPLRIGQRRPNPLGLHDTVGNAAEMTMDTFKLTLGGRLHGSSGGFVSKGGSFLSGPSEILPGSRAESAYFYKDGPIKSRDLGLRLVLSSLNIPGGNRSETLSKEWSNLGEQGVSVVLKNLSADPLAEIDKLITNAKTDDEKKIFTALRSKFKDYNVAVERSATAAILAHVRSLVNIAYGIRNTSLRKLVATTDIEMMGVDIDMLNNYIKKTKNKDEKKTLTRDVKELIKQQQSMKKAAATFDIALVNQFKYYKLLLEDAMDYDPKLLAEQMAFVKQDIKGTDVYTKEMRSCYGYVDRDIKFMKKGQPRKVLLENLVVTLKKK